MAELFDVVVVGSGPAGSVTAATLVESGLRVLMLDVGNGDEGYLDLVPDQPFSAIRSGDPEQRRYLLGDDLVGVPRGDVRVGAQLTPPRQFVTRDAERLLPVEGEGFEPMQSLALGGLGAAWGAASFTYTEHELRRIGLPVEVFRRHYDRVARRIGLSGDPDDDASATCFAGIEHHQPPLELDSVSGALWHSYQRKRAGLLERGLALGRTPLAVLSRDLGDRRANPYFDMDFWGDSRRSVFRPRYLVEALEREEGFRLERRQLVCRFEERGDRVRIETRDLESRELRSFEARRLVLAAGAINSARLALHSLARADATAPILCNPYHYVPCVSLSRLGRSAQDRRHSLSQLVAIYSPEDDREDFVTAQIYGYRSLLLFKFAKEIPLPAWAGLLVSRLLVNSIAIVGIHHSDAPHGGKTLRLVDRPGADLPAVHFDYRPSDEERELRTRRQRRLLREFLRLGMVPIAHVDPGNASSIHYAGTLPMQDGGDAANGGITTRADGRLQAAPRVYVADSSSWRFLPAKGLTLTIMANADRVAENVVRDLRGGL